MSVNLNVCGRKSGEIKYSDVYVNGSFLSPSSGCRSPGWATICKDQGYSGPEQVTGPSCCHWSEDGDTGIRTRIWHQRSNLNCTHPVYTPFCVDILSNQVNQAILPTKTWPDLGHPVPLFRRLSSQFWWVCNSPGQVSQSPSPQPSTRQTGSASPPEHKNMTLLLLYSALMISLASKCCGK